MAVNIRILLLLTWLAPALAAANDSSQSPIFSGCDEVTRAPGNSTAPAAPVVDRFTERSFASFSMDDVERGAGLDGLCWARLDGVWRTETPIVLDDAKVDHSIWGAAGRQHTRLANGNYTVQQHLVVVASPRDEHAIYVATGLGGDPFVRFESRDGLTLEDVLKRGGQPKRYAATQRFAWGNQIELDVSASTGRVRLRLGRMTFYRPATNTTREEMESRDPALTDFTLPQMLGYLAASRRGYDLALQDPLYLNENPKLEIFAEPGQEKIYLAERRIVPANLHYIPESVQGTVFRKSLISSEQHIQETEAHSFGANLSVNMGETASGIQRFKASAGFNNAKESSRSMTRGEMKARAIGYSRQKKYALVLDHVYTELSDAFIEAVEDAHRNHRYQALIQRFGTHYPYAVTYGATARMTMDMDETSYANRLSKSESFSANAGLTVFGVGGEVNMSEQAGETTAQEGRMVNEQVRFIAVGGNGSWDNNGYSAGEDQYPILLDLRPISELLNPMYFPGQPEIYVTVRKNLEATIRRYLDSFPASQPISTASWIEGIEAPKPVEVVEKPKPKTETWYVYVRQIWCGGVGSGRIKRAIGDRLKISGTVGSKVTETTKVDGLETECKYKNSRKKFDYSSSSPGLITLRGTREELRRAIIDLELRWFYDKRSKKERNDSRSFSLPVDRGIGVNKSYDEIWTVRGKTLPEFNLRVRFKRKK